MRAMWSMWGGLTLVLLPWGMIESGVAIARGESVGSPAAVLASGALMGGLLSALALLPAFLMWMVWARKAGRTADAPSARAAGWGLAIALVVLCHAVWSWNLYACQYVRMPIVRPAGVLAIAIGAFALGCGAAAIAMRIRPGVRRLAMGVAPALAVVAMGAACVRLAATHDEPADGHGSRPNVLLVTFDTVRADHTSPYGYDIRTPALQELADGGAVFLNAVCHLPLTGPSHASLLSGLLPRRHGVRVNGHPIGSGTPLVSDVLRACGYRTAAFVSSYPLKRWNCGLDRGFDVYDDTLGRSDRFGHLLVVRLLDRVGLLRAVERRAGLSTDRCLGWLADNRSRPFFIWLHYFDAHTPYEPPAEYRRDRPSESPVDLYDGEIEYMDAQLARVLRCLDEYGLTSNTLVVAAADHGESLGEHGVFYDHGADLYEPSLHVPLVFRFPGRVPAGVRVAGAVGLADVAPTVLQLLGVEDALACDGRDVSALWGEHAAWDREWVLAEQFRPESAVDRVAVRGVDWKTIGAKGAPTPEVYSLRSDPGETNDLALSGADGVAQAVAALVSEDERAGKGEAVRRVVRLDRRQKEKLKSLGYAR